MEGCTVISGDVRSIDTGAFPHRYGVIVADPPWQYRATTGRGIAKDNYDVLTPEQIGNIPVAELALDDSALFLWGTWPMLPDALRIVDAWGFTYKTGWPYVKTHLNRNIFYGVGRWIRGATEYVLMGVRGKVRPNTEMKNYMGIISPNLTHSRKPSSVHQIAETLPGPYLELFARRTYPGWTVFGNEVERLLL